MIKKLILLEKVQLSGVNIRKLFKIIENKDFLKDSYWDRPDNLQEEKFPSVKPKEKKMSRK